MTDLSPAAKVVMIAATNNNFNVVDDPVYKQCIAAALRAAASKLREAYANEEYVDSPDDWLDSIAAELENHQ